VSHPGEDDPFGTRRPSYWAGDGIMPWAAQWRNLVLLHYRLDDPRAIPWTHAYLRRDAFDEVRVEGRWAFLRSGRGVGAVMAANGLETVDGPTAGYELRSPGRHNSWLLRVDSLQRFKSLDAFAEAMRSASLNVEPGSALMFADPDHGVAELDRHGRLMIGGQHVEPGPLSATPELTRDVTE
jgi:hypothetical protein